MPAQHASAPTFCCATLKAIAIGNTDNSRPLSPAPAHNFPRSEPNCSGRPSSARRLVGATVPRPACSTLSPVLLRAHAHRQQQLRKPCGVHVPLQEGAQQRLVRARPRRACPAAELPQSCWVSVGVPEGVWQGPCPNVVSQGKRAPGGCHVGSAGSEFLKSLRTWTSQLGRITVHDGMAWLWHGA